MKTNTPNTDFPEIASAPISQEELAAENNVYAQELSIIAVMNVMIYSYGFNIYNCNFYDILKISLPDIPEPVVRKVILERIPLWCYPSLSVNNAECDPKKVGI